MKIRALLSAYTRWMRYESTISALSRLSDNELKDIGVNRCEIPNVAYRVTH